MGKKNTTFCKFIFIILLIAANFKLQAQCALYPIDLNQKNANSSHIVEGKVINQQCFKRLDINRIFTVSTVEVFQVFKGNTNNKIQVITQGGIVANEAEFASSLLKLEVGDAGTFFLYNSQYINQYQIASGLPNLFEVYASAQGFVRYNLSERSGNDIFNNYQFIATGLYPALINLTGNLPITVSSKNIFDGYSSGNRASVINSFSPAALVAGKNEEITIIGFGFGNARNGNSVQFKNSDDGGNTYILAQPEQYKLWSNNKIVVEVPSKAGTGKIKVSLANEEAISNTNLTITYALLNTGNTGDIYFPKMISRNLNKGYEWKTQDLFLADTTAWNNFLISFKKWRCATLVNWTIGSTTTISKHERDTNNVVAYDTYNELDAGVLGLCYTYYNGCTEKDWYVTEYDILFKQDSRWFFGEGNTPINKLDFQSVVLHELGHAHQLSHVIAPSNLMNYSIGLGSQKRTIDAVNLTGALWSVAQSTANGTCDKNAMKAMDADLCEVVNFGFFEPKIYPNPFSNTINIDLYLAHGGEVKISLYTLQGQLLAATQESAAREKGVHTFVFDAIQATLSNGVYIIKIESGDGKTIKKVVKL
jgi:hypothetical protein